MTQSKISYLPTIPKIPEYPVRKKISRIFARNYRISWFAINIRSCRWESVCKNFTFTVKTQESLLKHYSVNRRFYQLHDFQRISFKHYGCLGFQDWFVDSETITAESVNQSFEGHHYSRSIRLYKEALEAPVQIKVEDVTGNFQNIYYSFLDNLTKLRENPSDYTL